MEPWAKRLVSGFEKDGRPLLVDVSQGVTLIGSGEPYVRSGEADGAHEHEHGGKKNADDPHIWTDPNNAITMTQNILKALVGVDPKNEQYYKENARQYLTELMALDSDIKKAVAVAGRREVVLGGRNAMQYFMKRYGLTARSAFDSCSAEQEPSIRTVAQLKSLIEKKDIRVIYYEELQEPRIARTLAEGTGARLLLLHSLHNLSKEELAAGETYISMMRKNLENLLEGLS